MNEMTNSDENHPIGVLLYYKNAAKILYLGGDF